MLLVYYRLYSYLYIIRISFDLDQSNVYRDISILEPLIKLCVPLPKKLYKRSRRARTIDEVEGYFPGFKAFVDSTEQEIPRPKNKREGRVTIRVKRRNILSRHNLWSIVMALYYTKLVMIMRKHDYEIFKNNYPTTPLQVANLLDLGYLGVQNDFPTVKSVCTSI